MAETSNEEKKLLHEVLPNVAAQIRGPLSILCAELQKTTDGDSPGAARMHQSCYQLMRLAGNLSAAEDLCGNGRPAAVKNDDIVLMCRSLCERIAPLAEDRGITLRFACAGRKHIFAYDRRMMERLLLNLLSNALKFTPAGGTVTVTVQLLRGHVLLHVTDTGCGIPPEKMKTLFGRYLCTELLDPTPHGLGLGLPLCQSIARAHGGRLFAESVPGEGTRVTADFPDEESTVCEVRDIGFDYAGGFDHVLVELSDALGASAYEKQKRE